MATPTDMAARLAAEGWTVDTAVLETLENRIELRAAGDVQLLVNPLRLRLLASLARSPASVKELAARFDVPATRLYHHIDLLEGLDAVRVVGSRRSGARTERCYGAVRGGVGLDSELLQGDLDQVAEAVAGLAALGGEAAAAAVRAGLMELGRDENQGFLALTVGRLTRAQRQEVSAELGALVQRVSDWSDENDDQAAEDAESTVLTLLAVPDVIFDVID